MVKLFKRVIIIASIVFVFGWGMLMMIQVELGRIILIINNYVNTIPGININLRLELLTLFTDFWGQAKYDESLRSVILVLGIILLNEIFFKVLQNRKS